MNTLQRLMDERGLSKSQVARAAGLSRQAVYAHLSSGPNSRGIGKAAAYRYACLFDVPPSVFLYPEGNRGPR